jgi:hypothetical protein
MPRHSAFGDRLIQVLVEMGAQTGAMVIDKPVDHFRDAIEQMRAIDRKDLQVIDECAEGSLSVLGGRFRFRHGRKREQQHGHESDVSLCSDERE